MENTGKMEGRSQIDSARLLLLKAAVLYERHGAGERETFNIFSVLRTETDEVNLHSRFLAALLSHRQPGETHRKPAETDLKNLKDFLCSVAEFKISLNGAKVEREHHHIDILIHNPYSKKAVIIENKLRASDQHRQLARYAEQMGDDYSKLLLYLTLDGRKPDESSADGREVKCVSYEQIVPWLKRCQERAYDDPALRESIAQYVSLVRKLTGNLKGDYMKDLKDLILQNNNLALVHDLNKAMIEVRVSLLKKLWEEIDSAVRKKIPDLPERSKESDASVSPDNIREFLGRQRGNYYHGLYYELEKEVQIAIEIEHSAIYFGVWCSKKMHYRRIEDAMKDLDGQPPEDEWPWWQWAPSGINFRNPKQREQLEWLADPDARKKEAADIAEGLKTVWDRLGSHVAGSAQGS